MTVSADEQSCDSKCKEVISGAHEPPKERPIPYACPRTDVTKTRNGLENRPESGPENGLGFHALDTASTPSHSKTTFQLSTASLQPSGRSPWPVRSGPHSHG